MKLPRLQRTIAMAGAGGKPTVEFQLWWQRFAEQIEGNFDSIGVVNADIAAINAAIAALDTDDIAEGAANLYYTDARARSGVAGAATGLLKSDGSAISAAVAGTDFVAPGAVTTSGLTMATARLLGRTTASTGAVEEITVGSGLSLSGGTLSATGGGSYGYTVTSQSASYAETATSGDQYVLVTGAAVTVTLPTAVGNTARFTFKLMVAGTMTLDGAGTETIDGALTVSTSVQYTAITIVSDNANWVIV